MKKPIVRRVSTQYPGVLAAYAPGGIEVGPGRNSVRIIGGSWRGRRLRFPDVPGLRPTPDRVRETLFNWLQHDIAGARCLDLFAGSGALGVEALSRGAAELVFVEMSVIAARGLREQLDILGASTAGGGGAGGGGGGVAGRGRVIEIGAARFLRAPGEPFDVVFADPPFGVNALAECVPLLDTGNWVKIGGLVYLECEKSAGAPNLPLHWELLKSKSAGEVGYHLARVNGGSRLPSVET